MDSKVVYIVDRVMLAGIFYDLERTIVQHGKQRGNEAFNDPFRALRILVEEVGEVADALSPIPTGTKRPKHGLDDELIDTAVASIIWLYTRREQRAKRDAEAKTNYYRPGSTMGVGSQGDGSSGSGQNKASGPSSEDRCGERGSHSVLRSPSIQDATIADRMGYSYSEADIGRGDIREPGNTGK